MLLFCLLGYQVIKVSPFYLKFLKMSNLKVTGMRYIYLVYSSDLAKKERLSFILVDGFKFLNNFSLLM